MNPNSSKCSYCELELPTPRFVKRHEKHCLVRLRRLEQPETALEQFMRLLKPRGEQKAVQS